ncbi:MAG TPA: hypothetical protein VII06_00375 [Chloroflexota bacterium]|jgi:hypothetical protein
MAADPREVLLVGSMPLQPAAAVFEVVGAHVGDLVRRMPDGEQLGWVRAAFRSHQENPALEVSTQVPLDAKKTHMTNVFRLKDGLTVRDLTLGPYGYARNAAASYAQFTRARDEGKVRVGTRLQVTMPGPGTSVSVIELPAEEILPLAQAALVAELDQVVASIPPRDLTIQLDVGMEAEHEEYLRRPAAFDAPLHQHFHWTHAQMADAVAAVANRVPADVELGIHICSIWHHDPDGGQDNTVLVDTANALSERITRPIAYVHLPIIPEHDAADFAALKQLRLQPDTKLFLGLIHLSDGLEGARRRVAAAREAAVGDFGVGFFCGLGGPPAVVAGVQPASPQADPAPPRIPRATPETIGAVLDLHRQVAQL